MSNPASTNKAERTYMFENIFFIKVFVECEFISYYNYELCIMNYYLFICNPFNQRLSLIKINHSFHLFQFIIEQLLANTQNISQTGR